MSDTPETQIEDELYEQARLLGMSAEREVDLLAKNRNLERALEKAEAKLIEERKMAAKELVRWVEAGWKLSAERDKAQADLDEERKEGEEQARLLGMGSEREAKLIAERDLWRAEAQRWREQALDLEAQIETAIKRLQWRQDNLDRGIKELKSGY
jgi:hypothetical protein